LAHESRAIRRVVRLLLVVLRIVSPVRLMGTEQVMLRLQVRREPPWLLLKTLAY